MDASAKRNLYIPLFVVYGAYGLIALRGLDFGQHWDEIRLFLSVRDTFRSGVMLPAWYNYPSLSYLLSFPGILAYLATHGADLTDRASILAALKSADFPIITVYMRLGFVAVSSLSLVWVYAAVLRLTRNVLSAIIPFPLGRSGRRDGPVRGPDALSGHLHFQ